MTTGVCSYVLADGRIRTLGTLTADDVHALWAMAALKWPAIPVGALRVNGEATPPPPRKSGFRDPATRAKALERLRDPAVQERKSIKRRANEQARREHEKGLTPEEQRKKKFAAIARNGERLRRYWAKKAERRRNQTDA